MNHTSEYHSYFQFAMRSETTRSSRSSRCEKPAKYTIHLKKPRIYCGHCREPLYERENINICGKNCRGLYWTIEDFKVIGNNVRMEIFMEDSECSECGMRNDPGETFVGCRVIDS